MKFPKNMITKLAIAGLISGIVLMAMMYIQGYDSSIGWNVTTSAESEVFFTQPFKKGPFEFSFSGKKYGLVETFSAGPITRDYATDGAIIGFILLGLTLLIAAATSLSRVWFIGTMGLFIFLVINMHLPEVGLFGFGSRSYAAVVILLCLYLIPSYVFHTFYSQVGLGWRWLCMIMITTGVIAFSGVEIITLQEQFITGSYFGLIVASLIFLLIVAEENIFGILFLVTQNRGGRNNHIHFFAFASVYLGILVGYYGNKAGFWNIDISFFNPFGLLLISSLVTLWSLRFKQNLFSINTRVTTSNYLYTGLGMVVLGFLSLAMFRGNDPVYEGYHYFIIYTHLAFGLMFFLYLFWNFIGPLGQGLQVFKIAYREQNFPYISAKLAGFAAIAGMFFLSNKEPFLLFQAGNYNYLGAQALTAGNTGLANSYFREGSIYGYDNHFSNYQMGYSALQKGEIKEANYRFKKASKRYPSPQTFINHAGTHAMMGETTPSIVTMKSGLLRFPKQNQLLNNLGLTYADLGQQSEAIQYLEQAEPSGEWTNAALVNYWKVTKSLDHAEQDYLAGNLAVKVNIIENMMLSSPETKLPFDTAWLYPAYPLHRLAFLINGALFFDNSDITRHLNRSLSGQLDEGMYYDAKNAIIIGHYGKGYIDKALEQLDHLTSEVNSREKGKYYNQAGLIALSQHAPELALGFFEKALDYGYQDARLTKAACLLELGSFNEADEWADYIISVDSTLQPLREDIDRLSSKEGLSLDQQFFNIYYNYQNYSAAELNSALVKADEFYIQSLWAKIASEQLKSEKWADLEMYRAVFNGFLAQSFFTEPDALLALATGKRPKANHPLINALNIQQEEEKLKALTELAQINSLNSPLITAISRELIKLDASVNYDVLIKAININKTNIPLRKAYVMAALENGLKTYAENVLAEIASLTTPDDYSNFLRQYNTRKEALEEATAW